MLAGTTSRTERISPDQSLLAESQNDYYGLYEDDHKIGWAHKQISPDVEHIVYTLNIDRSTAAHRVERRSYSATDGRLESFSLDDQHKDRRTQVEGKVTDGALHLRVTENGEVTEKDYDHSRETARDIMAKNELARVGLVGAQRESYEFDLYEQKQVKWTHEIVAVEWQRLDGKATAVVHIRSQREPGSDTVEAWYDSHGAFLQGDLGGFIAKREPLATARNLAESIKFVPTIVVPKPVVSEYENVEHLEVTVVGIAGALPPESKRQKVDAESRQPGSQPVKFILNKDPVPRGTLPLETDAVGAPYLLPSSWIQSDSSQVRKMASTATLGATQIAEVLANLTHYVNAYIKPEYGPNTNALQTIAQARGDCVEYGVLFVALARALGIPARAIGGVAYAPDVTGFAWHSWAEVRVDGRWIAVDPTWNQPIADVTHIRLTEGDNLEDPKALNSLLQTLSEFSVVHVQK